MAVVEDNGRLTITLPQSLLEQVRNLAAKSNLTVERETEILVERGLQSQRTVREKFEQLSDAYRARLAREGKLDQSDEEVMDELHRMREQVANELYPD